MKFFLHLFKKKVKYILIFFIAQKNSIVTALIKIGHAQSSVSIGY